MSPYVHLALLISSKAPDFSPSIFSPKIFAYFSTNFQTLWLLDFGALCYFNLEKVKNYSFQSELVFRDFAYQWFQVTKQSYVSHSVG